MQQFSIFTKINCKNDGFFQKYGESLAIFLKNWKKCRFFTEINNFEKKKKNNLGVKESSLYRTTVALIHSIYKLAILVSDCTLSIC